MTKPRIAVAPELAALLLVAFALRLGTFYLVPNIHWPDEIYQAMEPAHRLVFGTGAVAWEWVLGARSFLFPGLVAALMEIGRLFGNQPAAVNAPVAVFLAAAGCAPVVCAYVWVKARSGRVAACVAASVPAVWVDLVYMSCHSLADVVAADCLAVALVLGVPATDAPVARRRMVAAGAMVGLTFALRFPLGPALAVAAIGMAGWRRGWAPWRSLIAGAAVPILAMGLLDWVTWGAPFRSIAVNLWFNLAQSGDYAGRAPAATFLVLPLYLWGAGFVAVFFTALIGARRLPLFGLVIVAVIATYSLFAHKEYRFIYPALVLAAILAGIGTADLLRLVPRGRWMPVAASVAALAWLGISAAIAQSSVYRQPWTRARAQVEAFDAISHRADACGVGLYGVRWLVTPGRSGLPPQVALYQTDRAHLGHDDAAFNYILAREQATPNDAGFQRDSCFTGDRLDHRWAIRLCVWHRAGGCDAASGPVPALPVNWPSTITGKPEPAPAPGWKDQDER